MKSNFMAMAAFAAMAAQNPNNLYDMGNGFPMGKAAPKRKCDQKKCKSCKSFVPRSYKGYCPEKGTVDPWGAACEVYRPRRKK